MNARRTRLVLAAALGAGLLLAGCSSGADSAGETSDAEQVSGGARAAAPEQARDAGGDRAAAAPSAEVLVDARKVVRQGSLSLHRRDVADAREDVIAAATAAGGYLGDERTRTSDGVVVGSDLTLVVPTARFDAAMDAVAEAGTVVSRRQSAEDVTEQVVDVDSRVRSAQASLDRVRTLLSRAERIGDVVQLEGVLSERQAALESLRAQQKSLASRTSTATIVVDVSRPATTPEPAPDQRGFVAGLAGGWDALVAVWTGLTTAVGAVLPLLLALGVPLAAVAWGATRVVRRVLSRRPQPSR